MDTNSAQPACDAEEILLRGHALFHDEQSTDLRDSIAAKVKQLQLYDVRAMDRVLAILCWGRSGSLLLSSYLDGHDDVIMLPEVSGWKLYEFHERYPSMPWRDRLIAYPAYEPHLSRFFDGDFPIPAAEYYAAIQAIFEFYADWPREFLESRRAFVLFIHIAYNLVLGRQPASSQPLIVYALHGSDDVRAQHVLDDFPRTKFVHTVRDPISTCDGMFQFVFGTLSENAPRAYTLAPFGALVCLVDKDRPQAGMESRTRTLRFEDLHCNAGQIMRDLADWLGLPYQLTLLDSTFNGTPYVVKRDGKAWSGRRVEQAQRKPRNLSRKDQALLFAFFHENFVEWDYPCPKIFGHAIVRWIVFSALFALPTKMEIVAGRAVFKKWILPSLRQGNVRAGINSMLGIGYYRLKIMRLLAPVFFARCLHSTALLQVEHPAGLSPRRIEDGGRVPSESSVDLKVTDR